MIGKVTLGNSTQQVSAICLGTLHFGTRVNKEISELLLDQYTEAGGSFVDTANNYSIWAPGGRGGESETTLGSWIKSRGNRADVFIATKMGFDSSDVQAGLEAHKIVQECEKSLKRLDVDTIDLYYAHSDDRNTPMEEYLEAFDALVSTGKVRFLGASNFASWRLAEARLLAVERGLESFCCIQQRMSYLRPRYGTSFGRQVAASPDLFDYCASSGVRMLAYSPLLHGAYTRPDRVVGEQYLGRDTDVRLVALREIANETGATLNQVVLAWMMQQRPSIIPIQAASRPDQLSENLASADLMLTQNQLSRLDDAGA